MRLIVYILLIFLSLPVESYALKSGNSGTKTRTTKTVKTTKKKTSGKSISGRSAAGRKPSGRSTTKKETAAEAKRREKETQQEIARTKKQIQENEAKVKKNLNELGRIQSDIIAGEKVVSRTSTEVSMLDARITTLETEIKANEAELSKMRAEYLKSLKKVRARKNSMSDIAFIFGADNFRQALQRMRYLRQISEWRQKRSKEIAGKVEVLNKDKEELAMNREVKDKTLQTQMAAQQKLQTKYARQDAVVATLKQNGKALKTHLSKKQAEANALKGRIASLIAEENRKAEQERRAKEEAEKRAAQKREQENLAEAADKNKAQGSKKEDNNSSKKDYADARNRKPRTGSAKGKDKTSNNGKTSVGGNEKKLTASGGGATKPTGSGFAGMRGSLPKPVNGAFRITSKFGKHALPDLPDVVYDNPGIDAEIAAGASAIAVYGGKVSGVYMIPGFSTVVIVNHGSYYTVYGNIASSNVRVGDQVKQGATLGSLAADEDNPGHSSIHFEVWHNRDKLNPEAWIR